MFSDKPTLYFRRKGKGAVVYRVEETANSRLDLQPVAMLKPDGEIKPQGRHELTADELAKITAWKEMREEMRDQETSEIDSYITKINNMAQWVQSKADDDEVKSQAQDLLMAMHDLRSTIVRRLAGKAKSK